MTLLRPALPVFDGLITIVRADDADAGVQALRSLEVGAPHVVVAWREGASVEPLAQAVTEIRDQLARLEDTTGTALAGVDVEQFRNELREVAGKLRTAVNRVDVDVGVDLEGSATWLDALGDFLAGKGRFAQARRRSEATSSR